MRKLSKLQTFDEQYLVQVCPLRGDYIDFAQTANVRLGFTFV